MIGLVVARMVRGSADFFVAGRRLSAPLIFTTVLASNIGAGATVGATGLGYRDGIGAWWWNGSAAIGSIFLALFIGPRVWRIASEHNLYTTGDYLELRYGPAVRAIVSSLLWLGTLSIFAGQLIAGAAVLSVVAHVPRWAGTIISASVVTIVFVSGGAISTVWTNVIQLIVLLSGFLIALPMVLGHVGGLAGIFASASVPPTFGNILHSTGPGSGWMLLVLSPAFVISPGLMQKAYGASSARAVAKGIGVQALVLSLFAFIPPLFGMAARVAHPGITDPNLVLPTVLIEQLPAALGALTLAAVFSAEVSTCDALLFMLATSLSQDLYKRFLRPSATDAQLLRVARLAAVAGGVGAVLFALWLPTVIDALRIFYALLIATLFVPIVAGLYTRRAGSAEALAGIAGGVVALLVVKFLLATRMPWLDPTLAGVVVAAVAFMLTLLVRQTRRATP
ncbi:MAG TPA: sodium:solute symporter family protein [Gemmatimonadaceae bacterium]